MNLEQIKKAGAEEALFKHARTTVLELCNEVFVDYIEGSFFNGLGNKIDTARQKLDELEEVLNELKRLNKAHS